MQRKKLLAFAASAMTMAVTLTACKSTPPGGDPGKKPETNLADKAIQILKATNPEKNPDAAKNRKDTIVIGIDAPDGVFNPAFMESAYDFYVVESMFADLLDVKGDGDVEPGLAESYKVSEDGKTYTFTLRKDLKWSDGKPITTDDVEFSFMVKSDKSYDGPSDMASLGIKGWKDYNEGKTNNIAGIVKKDARVIEITLDNANAAAIYDLGTTPLPKHYYGTVYSQGNADKLKALHRKPEVVSGAYKFKSYADGQQVVLEANENFYRGKAKIPNLIYKVTTSKTAMQQLETGEVDMNALTVSVENVDQVKAKGFLDSFIYPTNGYGYIAFNHTKPQWKDPKVRQALAYGLNRDAIVKNVYKGYADVINIPQSKVAWAYTEDGIEKYEFNQEKANKLLDDAGWKKGADGIREKDGKKLEIRFLASTPNTVNDAIIPIATENYKALGIKFLPEQMDFNSIRAKNKLIKEGKADHDMYFMAWGLTPEPDPTNIFTTNGSQNEIGYSNAKVDELCKKGLEATDKDKRKDVYKQLYQEINKDLPYIFMYQRRDMWAVNSRVKNMSMTPYRRFTYELYKLELQ